MKVILIADVKKLGKKNDVVTVSDGYYKNFLAKHKLAVAYTEQSQKMLQNDLAEIKAIFKQNEAEAIKLKNQIEALELHYTLKAHNGQAFGSISAKQIITTLKNEHQIEVNKFNFNEDFIPLKLGAYQVQLKLFETVTATLKVIVTEADN